MYRWRAFESFSSELLKKDQSGHSNLWKALKVRRTSNLTYSKTDLKSHTKKTVITFVHENNRIPDKCVQQILLRIHNKSNYIYLWWKEKETA